MSASTPSLLRVAIIGAGQVADKVHASYYATRSDVQMVAVMDSGLEQAQAFAERHAIPSVWQNASEMLQAVKPDGSASARQTGPILNMSWRHWRPDVM